MRAMRGAKISRQKFGNFRREKLYQNNHQTGLQMAQKCPEILPKRVWCDPHKAFMEVSGCSLTVMLDQSKSKPFAKGSDFLQFSPRKWFPETSMEPYRAANPSGKLAIFVIRLNLERWVGDWACLLLLHDPGSVHIALICQSQCHEGQSPLGSR